MRMTDLPSSICVGPTISLSLFNSGIFDDRSASMDGGCRDAETCRRYVDQDSLAQCFTWD